MHLAAYTESSFLGGGERALATLLRGLDPNIAVTVIGTDPKVVEAVAGERPSARIRMVRNVRNKRDAVGIAAQFRAIREVRPDVLHANGNAWTCQYALSAGVATSGVKTLAVHHAMIPPRNRRQVWLNRLKLKRLDGHVAVSRRGARSVEEMSGLAPGSVRVIYNGVPDVPVAAMPRRIHGPVVGSVGRLSAEKGHDVLLRALAALPGVRAVLVGDGPDRPRLEALARELALGDRLIMPGWRADPRPWLATFDVFVMPSRLEALGLAMIEAMLASRPVVATTVGGIPEVVEDGETGLLVPPDDPPALAGALRVMLDDPARRERMGTLGRSVATHKFGVDRMVRSYESVYGELLEQRSLAGASAG
jgi:glycosyltransferase involved in cell wall biosynthesis